MKKILCLIICLVISCMTLISCSKNEIGSYNYPEPPAPEEPLKINMYIIVDEASKNAMDSIRDRISGHTKITYETILNVKFITANVYQSTVTTAIEQGGPDAPHIILINSEAMFDSLINADGGSKLADLTSYYDSKEYGQLNSQIAASLIQSSKVSGRLYTVPNNHVVDQYKYLVVNKDVCHKQMQTTTTEIEAYKSIDDAAALIAKMTNAGIDSTKYIYEVTGPYELKAELEAQGNFCNIINYPIATRAEAFSTAFAIVNNAENKYIHKSMQMIYAINNDLELRNLLQYGVRGANYVVEDGNIVRLKDNDNIYSMNLSYTGNVFNAEFCSELKWTQTAKENGLKQNKDSTSFQ